MKEAMLPCEVEKKEAAKTTKNVTDLLNQSYFVVCRWCITSNNNSYLIKAYTYEG